MENGLAAIFDNRTAKPREIIEATPTLIKPHVFKEMRAIKATSLHRKVTKPLKSWEKQQEDKNRGWRGRGDKGDQPRQWTSQI